MLTDLQHGFGTFYGTPSGYDALVLLSLAKKSWQAERAPIIHIALDDAHANALHKALTFFASHDIHIIDFPAWDCLPYDRISPHKDILAKRAKALTALTQQNTAQKPTIVITTINAALQRIPAPENFKGTIFNLKESETLDIEDLQSFLIKNSYTRTPTVREQGEFSIRGGIIDLWPATFEDPIRLDLFDDEIDSLRFFNPISQRSLDKVGAVQLGSTTELRLDDDTSQHFRAKYREYFGAVRKDDPLYEAIGEKRPFPGMEHWLPLFYNNMTTLFDLLPKAPITLAHQVLQSAQEREQQIADFYHARQEAMETNSTADFNAYKPIPPHLLYLDQKEWDKHINSTSRPIRQLSAQTMPEHITNGLDKAGKPIQNFVVSRQISTEKLYEDLSHYITTLQTSKHAVMIACSSKGTRERIIGLFREHNFDKTRLIDHFDSISPKDINFVIWDLDHGFVSPDLAVISEQDILGDRLSRPVQKKRKADDILSSLSEINIGDYVVHYEHGVGRFEGLETLTVGYVSHDFLKLIYADDNKLYVPVENIDVLSRFGSDAATVSLDKLGGIAWQKRKASIKKDLMAMAEGLLKIAAERHIQSAPKLDMPKGAYEEFCARFPYHETDDQLHAIQDVLDGLQSGHAMDHLVCGDVGFGKTEVALRAAFVAAMNGLQVAVIVPTTLLARQHTANFQKRFKGFPIKIGQLSRFVTPTQATKTKQQLQSGQLDIVIGTHALLSNSLKFANLGLVIVDEEQHFGVKQKEKLKALKNNVHVLTLTATPIPRTLQLAMSGVRGMSIIATPPVDRLAVRTFILPFDPIVIREAILREHYRGGQIFYVCPRISDLEEVDAQLRKLVPDIKIIHAHGQMPADELDQRMTAFDEGRYQLLLATNIIESGIDIPNANTLIVHRSDLFGLAQLYQIRGRVGRSKVRAYAYLTHKNNQVLSKSAQQRLHVMSTLDNLGAGFQLASHDLDIRGAGNLLGDAQSGHIREIGVELYQQMLEEAVQTAKAGKGLETEDTQWSPIINLGLNVMISEDYVSDLSVRLSLYRRLSDLETETEIENFAAELIDRFGPIPESVENLLQTIHLKQLCKTANIEKIDAGPKGALINFRNDTVKNVDGLLHFIQEQKGTVKIRPDQKLSVIRVWQDDKKRLNETKNLLQKLAKHTI